MNEIDDLVQEAFARIWATDLATIRNGRAYFFATVRHLLAEYARRRRVVPIELKAGSEFKQIRDASASQRR